MNLGGMMNCFGLLSFWIQILDSHGPCIYLAFCSVGKSLYCLYSLQLLIFFLFSCYCHLHLCSPPSVGTSFFHYPLLNPSLCFGCHTRRGRCKVCDKLRLSKQLRRLCAQNWPYCPEHQQRHCLYLLHPRKSETS